MKRWTGGLVAAAALLGASCGSDRCVEPSTGEPSLRMESAEYAVCSVVLQHEYVDSPDYLIRVIVIHEQTLADVGSRAVPALLDSVRQEMPGVPEDLAIDFAGRNADTCFLEPRFALSVPCVVVSEQELDEMFNDRGWYGFYLRYPASQGLMAVSRVGFSACGDKALVYVGNYCDAVCGSGSCYLLIRRKAGWAIEDRVVIWSRELEPAAENRR
jgi:hypothetical protein